MKNLCGLLVLVFLAGCQPYMTPKYYEVKPNETCFMVKLEGDTKTGQAKLESSEFLEAGRIQAKRVEIPQRWNQTGRGYSAGEWIPTSLVICVDRTPVTREWTQGRDGT
ncbi:MAG: hypothetical protein WC824_15660, partial [Bacteroidota bacterium]